MLSSKRATVGSSSPIAKAKSSPIPTTYEELQHQLEALDVQDQEIIIEYIERPDCAYVY
jgi:hypothetical protein